MMEYLGDLKRAVFNGGAPDANRRQLQRVYVQRLEALIAPPAAPAAGPGGGGGGQAARFTPFVTAPVVPQSDLPAMARLQLRELQRDATALGQGSATPLLRAHWQDIAERAKAILDPR
jgi:hypothetical protein